MTLIVRSIDGLHLSDAEQRIIRSWKSEEVKIKPYDPKRDRTKQQNRYLWLIYGLIASHTGHSSEDIHEFLKWTLLPRKFIHLAGDERYIAKSTATLSTEEFSQYVEAVRAWAASELSISTPEPQS